ncbi:unnamed protein product [Hermetia illucens]|uniref:gamma-glutamylcyclotransferase n=1 Tax=Hermetia illucens TaxID=343691 RepID=A0A7R8UKV6_HERIL|nr:gamma-glutamylcyclotransferase-like isoform X2 [Hermetia illucens]CAD7082753.1 unnamed protein product [Hermetia illucens]
MSSEEAANKRENEMVLPEIVGNKFLYFGFGSNLLLKRIRIQNKTAVRKNIGKLKDYELDFYTNSTRWQGAPATIVPRLEKTVWGAVWEIDLNHMDDLDKQEGVDQGVYIPISVPIETPDGQTLICRAYRLTKLPPELRENEPIPFDRQPSSTYLKTIIKGAIESGLPEKYIEFLKHFKHNGNTVESIEKDLELSEIVI